MNTTLKRFLFFIFCGVITILILSAGITYLVVDEGGISNNAITLLEDTRGSLRAIVSDSNKNSSEDSKFSWIKLIGLPILIIGLLAAFVAVITRLKDTLNK